MKNLKRTFKDYFSGGSFCFYCNVDSEELRVFLIIVIVGLVFVSLSIAAGSWIKGAFGNFEDRKPLRLEDVDKGE